MSETKQKPMTATERKELRRIIGQRFELLDQELAAKRAAVKRKVELEIQARKQERITYYEAALRDLNADAEALVKKGDDLYDAMRQEGLTTSTQRGLRGHRWNQAGHAVTVDIARQVGVAKLGEMTQAATAEILEQHGIAKLNLSKMQLDIEERLATSALISDQAQEFLSLIPDPAALLPKPDEVTVPAIEAAPTVQE